MLSNKYCLPIRVSKLSEIISRTDRAMKNTQFVELWLDYIDDLEEKALKNLVKKYPGRIVLVFRRDKLETPHMGESIRRKLLTAAAQMDVLVDLDITTQQNDIAFFGAQERKAQFIASFHDYNQTPDNLEEIADEMQHSSPDIYKIATFCNSDEDATSLINLKQKLNQQNKRSVVLGMGEKGKLARLVCNFWGNELIFAPASDAQATAPGQFTRTELEEIDRILG